MSRGRKTRRVRSASSAESCIRKAVAERGLTPGHVGLTEASRPRHGQQRADPTRDAGLFTGVQDVTEGDEIMRSIGWRLPILAMSILSLNRAQARRKRSSTWKQRTGFRPRAS